MGKYLPNLVKLCKTSPIMLKTHDRPMGKEIKLRINACYGDLRPSEKKAADYVLKHLDELKNPYP